MIGFQEFHFVIWPRFETWGSQKKIGKIIQGNPSILMISVARVDVIPK